MALIVVVVKMRTKKRINFISISILIAGRVSHHPKATGFQERRPKILFSASLQVPWMNYEGKINGRHFHLQFPQHHMLAPMDP
jgi:hypothetical protein